jgi:ankyrin repeat protein
LTLFWADNVSLFSQSSIIGCSSTISDWIDIKGLDPTKTNPIGAWIVRSTVIAALRQLLEDMELVRKDNIFGVKSIGDQINLKNHDSLTALHLAVTRKDENTVKSLLVRGADVNLIDKIKYSLDDNSSIAKLLSQTVSTHVAQQIKGDPLECGWTALMIAAEIGHTEEIDEILKRENNINSTNSKKQTALHIAASFKNSEAVKLLVQRKASLEGRDVRQHTALCSAAKSGCAKSVRILAEEKADVNVAFPWTQDSSNTKKEQTVLDLAIKSSDTECIRLLKEYGVEAWTPLMVAVEKGPYCVGLFLETRDNLIRLHDGKPFNDMFHKELMLYSNLKMHHAMWKWSGDKMENNLVVGKDGFEVMKVRELSPFSCILGDVTFMTGIHRWTLKVNNVRCMWAGVAQSVRSDQLGNRPGGYRGDDENGYFVVFWNCDNMPMVVGDDGAEISVLSQSSYSDNQILDFELDMYDRSLKFSVDGVLAAVVSNLSGRELEPYICMGSCMTVELLASESFLAGEEQLPMLDVALAGQGNSKFFPDLDTELLNLKYSPPASVPDMPMAARQPFFKGGFIL